MKLSKYYLKTLKESPRSATVPSHNLMLRAGMIKQSSQGIYTFLPLATKVLNNINNIIKEEMTKSGFSEVIMPLIQSASLWKESGRYDSYGKEMLRVKDRHENEMLFGPTAEEVATDIFRQDIVSYRDLPCSFYQIHWKFRDEIRPRFGILRGKEFLMFDGYSFDIDEDSALLTYFEYYKAFMRVFDRIGVDVLPIKADSGPIGGSVNHEFHIPTQTGESDIFYEKDIFDKLKNVKNLSDLDKIISKADVKPETNQELEIVNNKGIEIGHIFYFGNKYSKPMKANVTSKDGSLIEVKMGSYGIGVSRIIAAVIEASHDEKGIIWPESIAPFKIIIIVASNDNQVIKLAEEFYNFCLENKIDALIDDTEQSIGSKIANANLIGIPYQLIFSDRNNKNSCCEFIVRKSTTNQFIDYQNIRSFIKNLLN
jgi:prolyl-tRNA synthetase